MTTQSKWKIETNRILGLPLEEKRKLYKSGNFIPLIKVDSWNRYYALNDGITDKRHTEDDLNEFQKITIDAERNNELCEKVAIFRGDITVLEVDAIVNAANSRLKAQTDKNILRKLKVSGGVDGAIHRAAGPFLQDECNALGSCPTGEAKVTGGYNLPAKYVIHTVGPQNGSVATLKSCYENCLGYQSEYKLKSIAFPCISTGMYGFPNRLAAHIALQTARTFLENNNEMDKIIFCTIKPIDIDIYETLMQLYFPIH